MKPEFLKLMLLGMTGDDKEKLMEEEGLTKTENDLIHIGKPIPFETDVFLSQLKDLMYVAYSNKRDIREQVEKVR